MKIAALGLLAGLAFAQDVLTLLPGDEYWAGMREFQKGRFLAAATLWEEAARKEPKHAEIWYQLGFAKGKLGDAKGKIEAWETTIALNPRHREALYALGVAHVLRGEKDQAMAQYGRLKTVDQAMAEKLYDLMNAMIVESPEKVPAPVPARPVAE
jgi:tetratricopeptide (TPR) repeat protein